MRAAPFQGRRAHAGSAPNAAVRTCRKRFRRGPAAFVPPRIRADRGTASAPSPRTFAPIVSVALAPSPRTFAPIVSVALAPSPRAFAPIASAGLLYLCKPAPVARTGAGFRAMGGAHAAGRAPVGALLRRFRLSKAQPLRRFQSRRRVCAFGALTFPARRRSPAPSMPEAPFPRLRRAVTPRRIPRGTRRSPSPCRSRGPRASGG